MPIDAQTDPAGCLPTGGVGAEPGTCNTAMTRVRRRALGETRAPTRVRTRVPTRVRTRVPTRVRHTGDVCAQHVPNTCANTCADTCGVGCVTQPTRIASRAGRLSATVIRVTVGSTTARSAAIDIARLVAIRCVDDATLAGGDHRVAGPDHVSSLGPMGRLHRRSGQRRHRLVVRGDRRTCSRVRAGTGTATSI